MDAKSMEEEVLASAPDSVKKEATVKTKGGKVEIDEKTGKPK